MCFRGIELPTLRLIPQRSTDWATGTLKGPWLGMKPLKLCSELDVRVPAGQRVVSLHSWSASRCSVGQHEARVMFLSQNKHICSAVRICTKLFTLSFTGSQWIWSCPDNLRVIGRGWCLLFFSSLLKQWDTCVLTPALTLNPHSVIQVCSCWSYTQKVVFS